MARTVLKSDLSIPAQQLLQLGQDANPFPAPASGQKLSDPPTPSPPTHTDLSPFPQHCVFPFEGAHMNGQGSTDQRLGPAQQLLPLG